jgi:hypothetical protein
MFGLDVGMYGRLATRDSILELATRAESSGVESLWVADHVIFSSDFDLAISLQRARGVSPRPGVRAPVLLPDCGV